MEPESENLPFKPLTYPSLKAIMQFSTMDQRERLARLSSNLRTINSHLANHFDEVFISDITFHFKIANNDRIWYLYPHTADENVLPNPHRDSYPEYSPYTEIHFKTKNYSFGHELIGVKKADAKAKLIKEYFKNGSTTRVLAILGTVPKGLEGVCIKAEAIKMSETTKEEFLDWLKIIDEGAVKEVEFVITPTTKNLLQLPVIQSCQKLHLQFPYFEPISIDDWFMELQVPQLHVIHINFPKDKLEELIRKWVNYRRPLGTSFTLGIINYTDALDVFEGVVERVRGKPSKFPEITDSFLCHCVTVPIDEDLELVVFGEPKKDKWPPFQWNLRIEIMKTGTTVSNILRV